MSANNGISSEIYIRACRACLNSKPQKFVLLKNEWFDRYKSWLNVDITDLEQTFAICEDCCKVLKQCLAFKEQCLKSETFWNSLLNTKLILSTEKKICLKESNLKIKLENLSDCDYEDEDRVGDESDNEALLLVVGSKEESVGANNEKKQVIKNKENIKNKNDARGKIKVKARPKKKTKVKNKGFVGICEKCDKTFILRQTLVTHIKLNLCEKDFEVKLCGMCCFECKSSDDIKKHLLEHYKNNDLICQICGFAGDDFADMLTHRLEHQPNKKPDQTGLLPCILCPKYCRAITRAEFHFRRFHLKNGGIKCSHCKKMFMNFKSCIKHQRAHFSEYLECNECGKKYKDKEILRDHIKHHHMSPKTICDTCGQIFNTNKCLKSHIYNMHTTTKEVQCDHCNKIYKNERTLKSHKQRIKRGKQHVCNICQKGFLEPRILMYHMQSHTGLRPFQCDMCCKNYRTRSLLSEHKKSVHFTHTVKCDECDKMFATARQLKRHKLSHTGLKPFPCEFCVKSFYDRNVRTVHYARHHSDKVVTGR